MATQYPFRTALVTGASGGIGREIALHLGRGGVRVALVARRKPELEQLADQISGGGADAVVIPADLAHPELARESAIEAEKLLGSLDLVVANAGIGVTGLLQDVRWEAIQDTMMVNALAPMALIHAVLPGMLKRNSGYIAGVSSLASYRGFPRSAAYSSSKAALSIFLESIRAQTHGQGIAITDIHPGYVRTEMTPRGGRRLPFLMEADRAARLILHAIVKKKPVYNFPWQMALLLRIVRVLPPVLYDRLVRVIEKPNPASAVSKGRRPG